MIKRFLIIITITFCVVLINNLFAQVVTRDPDFQYLKYKNLLQNPGGEQGTAGWTSVGSGTVSLNSTAANVGIGSKSLSFDASTASDEINSASVTIPRSLYGKNCLASFVYNGGDSNLLAQVASGANILVSQTLTATTVFRRVNLSFICPSSGSIVLELQATANAVVVYLDDAYIGENYLTSTSNRQTIVGTSVVAQTTNCAWSGGAGSWANYTADTDCPDPTVTGDLVAAGTKIPAIVLNNAPPGNYLVIAQATLITDVSGSADTACNWRLSDGTNVSGLSNNQNDDSASVEGYSNTVVGNFTYTNSQSSITWQLQNYRTTGDGACLIRNDQTVLTQGLQYKVYRFPIESQEVYQSNTEPWLIDANIGGANVSLGTSAQSSYVAPNNSGLTLTVNKGSDRAPFIGCSSTNTPTGTTCVAGNEEPSVSFVLPRAGTIRACWSFTHLIELPSTANASVFSTFQLVETATNSQTIVTEGNTRIESGLTLVDATSAGTFSYPHTVCSNFTFDSSGRKMIRLMYEQSVANSPTQSLIIADEGASNGQRDIHVTIFPIDQSLPMPNIVNSVSSTSAGSVRLVSAEIDMPGTPAVTRQDGDWIASLTDTSAGNVVLNLTSGTFTVAPNCTCTIRGTAEAYTCKIPAISTSQVNVIVEDNSGTDTDEDFMVVCVGEK